MSSTTLTTFKPGFIPTGWIKGEALTHIEPKPGRDHDGRYALGMVGLKDSLSRAGNGEAIPALYYIGSDAAKVREWFDWWQGNTTDPQPPEPLRESDE